MGGEIVLESLTSSNFLVNLVSPVCEEGDQSPHLGSRQCRQSTSHLELADNSLPSCIVLQWAQ